MNAEGKESTEGMIDRPHSDMGEPPASGGKPIWPLVIGLLSIFFAAHKVLELLLPRIEIGYDSLIFSGGWGWGSDDWLQLHLVFEIGLAILLLWSGIGLLRRKRWAAGHLPYAVTKLAWSILFLVSVFYFIADHTGPVVTHVLRATAEYSAHGLLHQGDKPLLYAAVLASALRETAYPFFLLVWFLCTNRGRAVVYLPQATRQADRRTRQRIAPPGPSRDERG